MEVSSVAEQRFLARARAGLSPSAADAARVRQLLAPALADGAAAAVARTTPAQGAPAGGRGWSWGGRLLAAAGIAAVAGAGGYGLGHRAGVRQPVVGVADSAPATIAVKGTVMVPVDPSSVRAPIASPPSPHPAPPPIPANRKPPSVPTTKTAPSLEQEVRALRAVERALRDGSPGLASALLRELDRAVPDGRLMEERAATATIARCNLGQVPFGVDLAETFDDQHPDSVYSKRVRQACVTPSAP